MFALRAAYLILVVAVTAMEVLVLSVKDPVVRNDRFTAP